MPPAPDPDESLDPATRLSLLRGLAHDQERLELRADALPDQTVLVLPETVEPASFTVVTLRPTEPLAPVVPAGAELELSGRLKGAAIRLGARLLALSPGRREWQLRLALTTMAYRQRREAIRIPVPPSHPAAEAAVISEEEVLLATVTDLTRVGLGLRLRHPEATLPLLPAAFHCDIGRGEQRIRVDLRLVHQRVQEGFRHCGGPFTVADPQHRRRLDQLVIELERLWLKRRPFRR